MSKALMKSLKADLPALAEMIRAKGRGRDTMLAHITPREAALLKRRGGSGTINPDTGLPEFDDGIDFGPTYTELGYTPPPEQAGPPIQYAAPDVQQAYQQQPTTEYTPQQLADAGYVAPSAAPSAAPAAAPSVTYDPMQASQEGFTYGGSMGQVLPQGTAYGTDFATAYAPKQLSQPQLEQLAAGEALAEYPGQPADKATTDKEKQSYLDRLLSGDTATKLGLASLLGLGLTKGVAQPAARQATQQSQQAAQQYQQLAQPYRQTSQNLIQSAQTGALTPSNLQAVNTARQIAAQNIRARGGVGVEQAANQTAQLEANLLEKQFSTGLQLANIADQFDAQAIQTALSANQGVVASNAAFYTQLANMLAPFVFGVGQMTSPTQPRTTTTGAV